MLCINRYDYQYVIIPPIFFSLSVCKYLCIPYFFFNYAAKCSESRKKLHKFPIIFMCGCALHMYVYACGCACMCILCLFNYTALSLTSFVLHLCLILTPTYRVQSLSASCRPAVSSSRHSLTAVGWLPGPGKKGTA